MAVTEHVPHAPEQHQGVHIMRQRGRADGTRDLEDEEHRLLAILQDTISTKGYKKFENIRRLDSTGGSVATFVGEWGPSRKPVIFKVEKTPTTPYGKRHLEHGCNNRNALESITGIEDPAQHHLVGIRDFWYNNELKELDPHFSGAIICEDYFPAELYTADDDCPAGETLEDRIKAEGARPGREVGRIFSHIAQAERYLMRELGIFNRDPNAKNILLKGRGGTIEARLTDHNNSARIEDIKEGDGNYFTNSGSRFLFDPLLSEKFTQEPTRYYEGSELYALGKNILYALTGKRCFVIDPDRGEAMNLLTDESLIGKDGLLDHKKVRRAVEQGITHIPDKKDRKKYGPIIRKLLSLKKEESTPRVFSPTWWNTDQSETRYNTIEEFQNDLASANRPGWFERNKRKLAIGSMAGLVAIGALGYRINHLEHVKTQLEQEVVDKSRYPTEGNVREDLEITNNLVDLGVRVSIGTYSVDLQEYPKQNYIRVEPGDKVWTTVTLREISRPKDLHTSSAPSLLGKVYIEGYESEEFQIQPYPYNTSGFHDYPMMIGCDFITYNISEDMTPGVHIMAVEVYAPEDNSGETPSTNQNRINFSEPGKAIARERIRIVVGSSTTELIDISQLQMEGYTQRICMADFGLEEFSNAMSKDLKYEYSFLGKEGSTVNDNENLYASNVQSWYLRTPHTDHEGETIMQVTTKRKSTGEQISTTFIPLKSYEVGDDFWWDYATPGPEFSETLREYRINQVAAQQVTRDSQDNP